MAAAKPSAAPAATAATASRSRAPAARNSAPPPGTASVILNQGLDESSLIVQGGPGADELRVSTGPGGWTVFSGAPVYAGGGCANSADPNIVTCPGDPGLALIVVTGNDGGDTLVIDPSVPANAKVRINGNAGNDTVVGGPENDVLEAGENYNGPDSGNDTLIGNGGNDVLYSDPGGDDLDAGAGEDLLVSSVPTCQGHTYDGGSGEDTVSYARSNDNLRIELGGTGGGAGCGNPDHILANNESLEGSDGPDVLVGDNGDNSMMGHLGADVFLGKGGDDFIDAIDGQHDKQINCGGGDDEVDQGRLRPFAVRLLSGLRSPPRRPGGRSGRGRSSPSRSRRHGGAARSAGRSLRRRRSAPPGGRPRPAGRSRPAVRPERQRGRRSPRRGRARARLDCRRRRSARRW